MRFRIKYSSSFFVIDERALNQLTVKSDLTLIDGNLKPSGLKNYKTIINGDEKIKGLARFLLLRKVYRDNLMIVLSKNFQTMLGK